jgi:lipoate-protein ligase A
MRWRLIDTDSADPFFVTAADDALIQTRKNNSSPNTLHFYRRNPPAISLGRAQRIKDIDLAVCKKNNIQLVRRISGGGSIYTDAGCLIYSLVFDQSDMQLFSAQMIFTDICTLLVKTLTRFNIPATYKPPNDILLHGKKISGSAQMKKGMVTLIHGTILVDTNLEVMQQSLQLKDSSKVSTLSREISHPPSIPELKEAFCHAFQIYVNEEVIPSGFTPYEEDLITRLLDKRYCNAAWTYRR